MNTNQKNKILFIQLLKISMMLLILVGCKKVDVKRPDLLNPQTQKASSSLKSLASNCDSTICEDCSFQELTEEDTTDYPTILGSVYSNPYSISTMTQAYNNVYGTSLQSVPTTHYYVKFKPQSSNDLNILDSLNLELYDYPLDREVLQDGDYWPDAYANLVQNEYPWLYTVVTSNFQFPSGMNYQIITSLNIPDDDAILEDEAFRVSGNYADLECGSPLQSPSLEGEQIQTGIPCRPQLCPQGYIWDIGSCQCIENTTCPDGYHWDGYDCVPDNPPTLYPKGMITYRTYNDYGVIPSSAPVKFTRVVGRRFFKIETTYTDVNGNFSFSKRFPRKVTIVVKFKTSSSISIRQEIAGLGVWKRWFPLKKNIGTYKGNDLRNLNYEFQKGSTSKKWKTRRWLAAIALNTTIEAKNFLLSNNLISLPDKLPIYLNVPAIQEQGETAQYEFIKNSYFDPAVTIFLDWITSDINSLTTSKVTINVAQQLGLLYLWNVGNQNYNAIHSYALDYTNASNYAFLNINRSRYGRFGDGIPQPGTNYNPDVIAIFQAYAQHFGHTIANKIYGYGESSFTLQGKAWLSGSGISGSTKYLEGFDPSIGEPDELFKWIPVGLINDLMDNTTDPLPVVDNVSGFTYSEIQSAYYMEPITMLDLRNALKSLKPLQATAIDQLFASYGY